MTSTFLNTLRKYNRTFKDKILNFDKFNYYAIVHHSNSIEGSKLTLDETYLLLDKNLTPKGKPFEHSVMAKDHLSALHFVLDIARQKKILGIRDIQNVSALIMRRTGAKVSTLKGDFDISKGEFRKVRVSAGTTVFCGPEKVVPMLEKLLKEFNTRINSASGIKEIYDLSFDFHYNLVTIHPFGDGNGRLSRLMMNFVQEFHQKPLTIVFHNDKHKYYKALNDTRKTEDLNIFRKFMYAQAEKYFNQQIAIYNREPKIKKGRNGITYIF